MVSYATDVTSVVVLWYPQWFNARRITGSNLLNILWLGPTQGSYIESLMNFNTDAHLHLIKLRHHLAILVNVLSALLVTRNGTMKFFPWQCLCLLVNVFHNVFVITRTMPLQGPWYLLAMPLLSWLGSYEVCKIKEFVREVSLVKCWNIFPSSY